MSEPLVIWRKAGKSIYLGREVRLTVLECTPGSVRLGVEAPADLAVTCEAGMEAHLAAQVALEAAGDRARRLSTFSLLIDGRALIGRDVTIIFRGLRHQSRHAMLEIQAPRNMAVSRDEFAFEEHLEAQEHLDALALDRQRDRRPA